MTKYLICTKNKDKFDICSKILSLIGYGGDYFYAENLDHEIPELDEVGSIFEIAKEKVIHYKSFLNNESFDFYIGIDDGFKLKKDLVADSDSKRFVKSILSGEFKEETTIWNERAYFIYNVERDEESAFSVQTPYIYRERPNLGEVSMSGYPLSKVLFPVGYDVPIGDLVLEERLGYYLRFYPERLSL